MTSDRIEAKDVYEAPALKVLGTLHDLTEARDKTLGPSDGFTFQGSPIANASP